MIGVWTGYGFNTIPLILPPPKILGYHSSYTHPVVSTPTEAALVMENPVAPVVEPPIEDDDEIIPFVIV